MFEFSLLLEKKCLSLTAYQPPPNRLQLILSPICYSSTAIQSEMRSLFGLKLVSP